MKTKWIYFILASSVLSLSSCSHRMLMKQLVKTENLEAQVANVDGSKRNAYFVYDKVNNRFTTLSEPPPDAIIQQATDLVNKLKLDPKVDTEQSVKLTESVIQLGQRTVAVNVLRDALFRLNEMNVNHNNVPIDSISSALFRRILKVAETIALADKTKAEAQQVQAEADKINANVELMKTVDLADIERKGYNFILNKDLLNATSTFSKLDELSPQYKSAFEISKFLKGYDSKSINESDWKAIFGKIAKEYSWKMPEELKQKMEEQANK
ncbi:hypothetical protein G4D82_00720 [Flavobacterium sp. CYK-4]|uniref:hypothetical protein n=1 Tax=Flavobacterium lotistagni TaxID=2709660 RepID=UPI001409BC78|nr:hypothetical protein [Flavobacterium lotistagni]NHM05730.1 hypothetical protein [Flavobacterium lotistagni]